MPFIPRSLGSFYLHYKILAAANFLLVAIPALGAPVGRPQSNFAAIFVTRKLESLGYRAAVFATFSHFSRTTTCDKQVDTRHIPRQHGVAR